MKLNKKMFKQIVKECLIELMSEGMGSFTGQSVQESKTYQIKDVGKHVVPRTVASRQPQYNPALDEAVKTLSSENPTLSYIFEDTAKTTLPQQNKAESNRTTGIMDGASFKMANSTVEDIFGEEKVNNWASLAFMPNKRL